MLRSDQILEGLVGNQLLCLFVTSCEIGVSI